MTVRSNHSSGFVVASSVTTVGAAVVSIGPPIRTIEAGWFGSLFWAIRETAHRTGTVGWHTAMTWVCGPR